jgi:hypothetical protein
LHGNPNQSRVPLGIRTRGVSITVRARVKTPLGNTDRSRKSRAPAGIHDEEFFKQIDFLLDSFRQALPREIPNERQHAA